jgi:hypothetical protein
MVFVGTFALDATILSDLLAGPFFDLQNRPSEPSRSVIPFAESCSLPRHLHCHDTVEEGEADYSEQAAMP